MPIYEYVCEKCHQTFEVWQKISEAPVDRHDAECGGPAHRVISQTSFTLKGQGWYKDHYGLKPAAKVDTGGDQAAAGPKPEAASKPEPAAKPDAGGTSSSEGSGKSAA